MKGQRFGTVLAWLAAVGYLATAWIHATGCDSVSELSSAAPEELRTLVPALWLSFSLNLVVIALMMVVIALKAPRGAAALLTLAALNPLSSAALQVWYLGFIPPTAILICIAVLSLAAAVGFSMGRTGPTHDAV